MAHWWLVGSYVVAIVVLIARWTKTAPVRTPAPRPKQVELVRQRGVGEGMAAALTMVLRYRDRDVTVEDVTATLEDVRASRRDEVAAVAARFGLYATPSPRGMNADFSVVQIPLGSLLAGDDQVGVLAGQENGRSFRILDPERGKRHLSLEEMAAIYSTIYSFEPTLESSREQPFGRMKGRLIPMLWTEGPTGGGPEALAMTLRYHGTEVTLEDVRAAQTDDDTTVLSLMKCARAMGFPARGIQVALGAEEALALLPPGSILHWNWDYLVVLVEVIGNHVHVVDPRIGWRRLTRSEFWGGFTGVTLLIEPRPAAPDRT